MRAQALLGEPLWRPPAPKGFSDDNAAWIDGLAQRLDIANAFAQRVADAARSRRRSLETALGPARLGGDAPAPSPAPRAAPQALALLLMSPEFQRR